MVNCERNSELSQKKEDSVWHWLGLDVDCRQDYLAEGAVTRRLQFRIYCHN